MKSTHALTRSIITQLEYKFCAFNGILSRVVTTSPLLCLKRACSRKIKDLKVLTHTIYNGKGMDPLENTSFFQSGRFTLESNILEIPLVVPSVI